MGLSCHSHILATTGSVITIKHRHDRDQAISLHISCNLRNMRAAVIPFLWLCLLLQPDSVTASNISTESNTQCLVGTIVNQALQLQQLSSQVLQQGSQLQEQASQLQKQESQLQKQESQLQKQESQQESQLQEQESQLQEQASQLQEQESQLQEQASQLQKQESQLQEQASQLQKQESQLQVQASQLQEQESQLQEQASQLQKLESQLQEQASQLQKQKSQQESQLQKQENQLQEQASQLQEQSSQLQQLRSLQEKVTSMESELEWQSTSFLELNNSGSKQVAFSARFPGYTTMDIGTGGTVKYNDVITNIGGGYSPLTGHFTAPHTGIYALFTSLRSSNHHTWILLAIFKGDQSLIEVTADGKNNPWNRGTTLVTTHMNKGEIAYVRQVKSSTFLEAGRLTTFSGMLVAAD